MNDPILILGAAAGIIGALAWAALLWAVVRFQARSFANVGFRAGPPEKLLLRFDCPEWKRSGGHCCPAGTIRPGCPGRTIFELEKQ